MAFDDVFSAVLNETQQSYIQYAKENKKDYRKYEGDFIEVYLHKPEFHEEVLNLVSSKEDRWNIIKHYIDDPTDIFIGYETYYTGDNSPVDLFTADIAVEMLRWSENAKDYISEMIE